MGLVACGGSETPQVQPTKTEVKVGLAYDIGGRGDKSFNDAAAAGLEQAKATFNITPKELPAAPGESENDKYTRLMSLCQGGYNPVIAVGFAYATALGRAATDCPDTKFAIVDDASVTAPNVTSLVFAEQEGSFLVGVAAALKSQTGHVGFIGGCSVPLIAKFEAGYIAGAKAADPAVEVTSNYLSTPAQACSGFNDPGNGKIAAEGLYDAGADVVYQAAGGSGTGVFQAAKEKGKMAIGVDSDQYNTVDPALKDVIITSMLKRVDVAVFNFIKTYGEGNFKAGVETFDLERDGVGYSTSGGFVDDIKAQLDDYKTKIVNGTITVPTAP
jgi:basic membrane protein A